ncbi:ArsR/SmtB family transcription factor [Paenibacillus lemnae]|uniref:Winged helix-turn-helix transcriptional regulator n=1 Tax=Paenibacillus lemnae TaxID=1330551 RepID=A0A848M8P2_PAELE|nr:winged helix-turn-helix domain-containing protein [Paenibacillus lemnae]NMO97015.1 winged helix-turn-helix transcriptional regulator [Paenibacillus lemnae]
MNLNFQFELDPVFETLGLLFYSSNVDKVKEISVAELNKFGVDGETFYNKHLKPFDRYIRAFSKHREWDEQAEFFFGDDNDQFFHLLLRVVCENPYWMTEPEIIRQEEGRLEILKLIASDEEVHDGQSENLQIEDIQTTEEIIAFLAKTPFDEKMKWKLMILLNDPLGQIKKLTDIVNRHLPAFEHARMETHKVVDKLIQKLGQSVENKEGKHFFKFIEVFQYQQADIYPTLIMPMMQIMYKERCYYGLMVDALPIQNHSNGKSQDLLSLRLKAMGDKSKLQILASLKISPKYNLEIAEHLGLTAATMSHHMNVLLACGLVEIEKKNGKVYYHLDQANIRDLLDDLEQFLL